MSILFIQGLFMFLNLHFYMFCRIILATLAVFLTLVGVCSVFVGNVLEQVFGMCGLGLIPAKIKFQMGMNPSFEFI